MENGIRHRRLGKSELIVSEIGLGCTGIGGHNLFVNVDERDSIDTLYQAIDLGVNFFDTADYYGLGRSEELIGMVEANIPDKLIIATKGGFVWDDTGRFVRRDNRPETLRASLEASLRRLRRDSIDLYYIHAPDGQTPPDESFGALLRFQEEGLIRYAGLSNFHLPQIKQASRVGQITAVQNQYNFFDRRPETEGLLAFCEDNHIGFVPYGALGFGILSGKYRRVFKLPESDWRNRLRLFDEDIYPLAIDLAHQIGDYAERQGTSLSLVAQRWVLRHPAVASTITGAKKPDQVSHNVQATDLELSGTDLAWIESRLDRFLSD